MRESEHPEITEHQRTNFGPMTFDVVVGKGAARKFQGYLMTQDGFAELAMSFTGEQARLVRIRFIAAFHAMAERLRHYEASIYARMLLQHEREDNFHADQRRRRDGRQLRQRVDSSGQRHGHRVHGDAA